MNAILQTADRILVSFTDDELLGISNALNEVCHGIHIDDTEFQSRLSVSRSFLADLLSKLQTGVSRAELKDDTRIAVRADGSSIQAICITVFGDPADLNCEEARLFLTQLGDAISEAECQ